MVGLLFLNLSSEESFLFYQKKLNSGTMERCSKEYSHSSKLLLVLDDSSRLIHNCEIFDNLWSFSLLFPCCGLYIFSCILNGGSESVIKRQGFDHTMPSEPNHEAFLLELHFAKRNQPRISYTFFYY